MTLTCSPGLWVFLPQPEHVSLGVLALGEVAKGRYRHFRHDHAPSKPCDQGKVTIQGIHADVGHNPLRRVLPFAKPPARSGCSVQVCRRKKVKIRKTGRCLEFPVKEVRIEFPCPCGIFRGYIEVDDGWHIPGCSTVRVLNPFAGLWHPLTGWTHDRCNDKTTGYQGIPAYAGTGNPLKTGFRIMRLLFL